MVCVGILLIGGLGSCVHDPQLPETSKNFTNIPCNSDTVYFDNDILPLLKAGCAFSGCHDERVGKGGVILSDYANVFKEVRSGDADNSELYTSLFKSGEERMPPPPHDAFSDEEKNLIKKWIDQGALHNGCVEDEEKNDDCDTVDVSYSNVILPILLNNCITCHKQSSTKGGGHILEGYSNVKTYVDNGLLYKSVAHLPGAKPMPYTVSEPIENCKIRKIKAWIDQGAQNN